MTWVWKCCRSKTCRTLSYNSKEAHRHTTRSQAVARIADLTAFCTCGVTWRHRSRDHLMPYVSFPINWWYFGTESLSPAVFDVLHSKCIGTTNLTFQGHVTSSVTWPFDSPYAISYWWSFGTKPLSLTVSEIFNVKCNAMVDVTLIRPQNKGQGHSFWYQPISHIAYQSINHVFIDIWQNAYADKVRLPRLSIVTFAL